MTYDIVHTFPLNDDKYLFFDIFCKNNEIMLICPVFDRTSIKYDSIVIKNNNKQLSLKQSITKIEYEPIVVLIYDIPNDDNNIVIDVVYNNITRQYTLYHLKTTITKKLSQTTLMKDDYKLINIFYDYYVKQGVEHFYIYYNGILNDDIRKIYNKDNITLIEWNYKYWNNYPVRQFRHHAQLGQLHHALYKYGKQSSEYMVFNDLDEYMYVPNKRLTDILNGADGYGFLNHWCNTMNNTVPDTFPTEFLIGGDKHPFGTRSKMILKCNSVRTMGVHFGKTYNKGHNNLSVKNDYMLLHFYNWSKQNRKELNINKNYKII